MLVGLSLSVREQLLVGVVLLFLGVLVTLIHKGPLWALFKAYRRRFAFKLTPTPTVYNLRDRLQMDCVLDVRPWKRVRVKRFNVRFVPTRSINEHEPALPVSTVEITSANITWNGNFWGMVGPDGNGGVNVVPPQVIECQGDESMRIGLRLQSHGSWWGYLSFRADIGEDDYYFGRIPAGTTVALAKRSLRERWTAAIKR
jgi:hypothetical protein